MIKHVIAFIGIIILIYGCTKEGVIPVNNRPVLFSPELIGYSGTSPNMSAEISNRYSGDFKEIDRTFRSYGFCYSEFNNPPTISDNVVILGTQTPPLGEFTGSITNIDTTKRYNVRGFGDFGDLVIYSSSNLLLAPTPESNFDLAPIASLGKNNRRETVAFSIGEKGYVGLGQYNAPSGLIIYNDLWEYDPMDNVWTQKADCPIQRYAATSFVIDGIGYVGTGDKQVKNEMDTSYTYTATNDFYSFDPALNQWDSIAHFPNKVAGAIGMAIGSKGYVIGGTDGTECLSTIYEYDATTDQWTTKTELPTVHCAGAGNTINGKAYVGMGHGNQSAFYEYDPVSDNVSTLSHYPGSPTGDLISFTKGNEIYFGFGLLTGGGTERFGKDYWKFDTIKRKWFQVGLLGEIVSLKEILDFSEAVSFKIGERVFVGSGQASIYPNNSAFFEVVFDE